MGFLTLKTMLLGMFICIIIIILTELIELTKFRTAIFKFSISLLHSFIHLFIHKIVLSTYSVLTLIYMHWSLDLAILVGEKDTKLVNIFINKIMPNDFKFCEENEIRWCHIRVGWYVSWKRWQLSWNWMFRRSRSCKH